jgi:lipopolysaccharide export LptBFGC system permease protein LptF
MSASAGCARARGLLEVGHLALVVAASWPNYLVVAVPSTVAIAAIVVAGRWWRRRDHVERE